MIRLTWGAVIVAATISLTGCSTTSGRNEFARCIAAGANQDYCESRAAAASRAEIGYRLQRAAAGARAATPPNPPEHSLSPMPHIEPPPNLGITNCQGKLGAMNSIDLSCQSF